MTTSIQQSTLPTNKSRCSAMLVSLCALLLSLLFTQNTHAQSPPTQPPAQPSLLDKLSPKKWFQRPDESANLSPAYPRELKVTPRNTAAGPATAAAPLRPPAVVPARATGVNVRIGSPLQPRDATHPPQSPVNRTDLDRLQRAHPQSPVQQTAFQQPSPRTYSNPVSGGSAVAGPDGYAPFPPQFFPPNNRGPGNEYPPHGNLAPPPGMQYPGQMSPAAGYPPARFAPPLNVNGQALVNPMRPGPDFLPPPAGRDTNFGNDPRGYSSEKTPEEIYPAASYENQGSPPFQNQTHPSNQSQYDLPPESCAPASPGGLPATGDESGLENGRGYLQSGSNYQGRYLNSNPQTATERALLLQTENERLRDALHRSKLEVENRTKELVEARRFNREKEQQLVDLKNQITQLKTELIRKQHDLTVALDEKDAIQRRTDEMLKSIEDNLDGVLMNTMSQSK